MEKKKTFHFSLVLEKRELEQCFGAESRTSLGAEFGFLFLLMLLLLVCYYVLDIVSIILSWC